MKKSSPVKMQKLSQHLAVRRSNAGPVERKSAPNALDRNMPSGKWLYRCKLSERGTCVIKPWLLKQSLKARANLDRAIEQLASQPPQSWSKPSPASTIGD